MRRWQHGEWYGDVVFPGWPGMAASSIPWIFPALHRDEREHEDRERGQPGCSATDEAWCAWPGAGLSE